MNQRRTLNNKDMKTKTRLGKNREKQIKQFIEVVAIKHEVSKQDIIIGMQGSDMVIQSFNTNKTPNWETLEIIEFN